MGTTPTKEPRAKNPDFLSPQLAAAMSHPTRVHTLAVLRERVASPRQVADEIGERLNNVTYHINQLLKLGCIELVRTERVRGGRVLEHFYRAAGRLYFDEEAWRALSEKERFDVVGASLRMIAGDVTSAMEAGTVFGLDNSHLSRNAIVVDEEGWDEVTAVIERATAELFAIEESVARRTVDGGKADIHARVELMQFRAPPFSKASRAAPADADADPDRSD